MRGLRLRQGHPLRGTSLASENHALAVAPALVTPRGRQCRRDGIGRLDGVPSSRFIGSLASILDGWKVDKFVDDRLVIDIAGPFELDYSVLDVQ